MSSVLSALVNGVNDLAVSQRPTTDSTASEEVRDQVQIQTRGQVSNGATVTTSSDQTMEFMDVDAAPEAGPSGYIDSDTETGNVRAVIVPRKPTQRASSLPVALSPDTRKIGYVYDDAMLLHAPMEYHPEAPERILGIHELLDMHSCLDAMRRIPIRRAKKFEVLLIHSEDHWDKVEAIGRMTQQDIVDSEMYYEHLSLYVCPETPVAAKLSCGGVIEASMAVAQGQLRKTFAIVRPPGHHAEPDEHMGFCFFNNIAVAARVVQQSTPIKRILILDWDVHHGNGTQRAFQDDPSVLYISLHRYEGGRFYPCGPFGGITSCGEGDGIGYSVNIPWPYKGMGDADYLHAFQKIVMPIAMEFAPELVMISAGFDAAAGDSLGECLVSPAGFAHMTYMLSGLAGGKLVVVLEGGYNVESISNSSLAVARVLLGEAPPELPPMIASEYGTEAVWQVAMQQSKFWKSVDPRACEPREEIVEHTMSIPEILKMHRQEVMYREFNMLQFPLMDEELDERFNAQVLCSDDVMETQTVVIFVHQFGNVRVELEGAMTCDMNLELSYLIDVTRGLIQWIREQKFGLIEVNTYPRPGVSERSRARDMEDLGLELVTYLWDNYVQLSKATRIILVGHGQGCLAIMKLMTARVHNVMKKVKAVIQVVGNADVPLVPKTDDDLRQWYYKKSFVAIPTNHQIVHSGKILKRHGMVEQFDEVRPVKLMSAALPSIQSFVNASLESEGEAAPTGVNGVVRMNGTDVRLQ